MKGRTMEIQRKSLLLAMLFAFVANATLFAGGVTLYEEKTKMQKASGMLKEGSLAATCVALASFFLKGQIENELVAALTAVGTGLAGLTAINYLRDAKGTKEGLKHPFATLKDSKAKRNLAARMVGAVIGVLPFFPQHARRGNVIVPGAKDLYARFNSPESKLPTD